MSRALLLAAVLLLAAALVGALVPSRPEAPRMAYCPAICEAP